MKVGSETLTPNVPTGYQPDRVRIQSTTMGLAMVIPLDLRRGERVPSKDLRMTQQTFCQVHWRYEDTTDAYRTCRECFHVFPTAQALLDDTEELWNELGYEPIRDVEQIYSCPHCTHDW
jgi:hypothetical protein